MSNPGILFGEKNIIYYLFYIKWSLSYDEKKMSFIFEVKC